MRIRGFITLKCAENFSDCQDRFRINSITKIVAVSDGISQSIFSAEWAELLSSYYADNGHCDEHDRLWLSSEWRSIVDAKICERKMQGGNTRTAERMLGKHKGAGATLCGVKFLNANRWEGHILGDSCIITVSKLESQYQLDFISSAEKEFDNCPDYYDSFPEKRGRGTLKGFSGEINQECIMILVSDPLAKFLKENLDKSAPYIEELLRLNNHEDFCRLVSSWRESGMDDDDTTLCIVEWDGSDLFQIIHEDNIERLVENDLILGGRDSLDTMPLGVDNVIPMPSNGSSILMNENDKSCAVHSLTEKKNNQRCDLSGIFRRLMHNIIKKNRKRC
ncbi:MAG: hypothetical protein IJU33_03165 [Bacteroidales bacterium]|nr:hypothetical protein [Bacteroidales bacterium]